MSTPEEILPTYERKAADFLRLRDRSLFEVEWLEALLALAPGPHVLDLGCGTGLPIAAYLASRGAIITGVDGAAAMIDLFRANLPGTEALHADMRGLALGRQFDAIVAFDSFFHLCPEDQWAMFPVFAAHAAPGAALLFNTGPEAGVRIGAVDGAPVYHASLAPEDYRAALSTAGFQIERHVPEDPACRGRTVWLARYSGL